MKHVTVLVIDDEENMCTTLKAILETQKYSVTTCGDARAALKIVENEAVNLIISDVRLPGKDGIKFLAEVKEKYPSIPVVMISAYGNMKSAVDAMKRGAYDYLAKPFNPDELIVTVNKALEYENLMLENISLKNEMGSRYNLADIIGESEELRKLKDTVAKVAPTDATVFIEGESGVGKELVAHSLHYHSKRIGKPFIDVNCAAFTESLLESELFGHEKGAFTGADRQKLGKFEAADGGTLYLDEIGDMSLALQSKVLRGLQERVFFRVGGNDPVTTDVRIVAATNKNLREEIEKGNFREDLFYRLNVINLKIPPLRERPDDIRQLAESFLTEFKRKFPDRKEIEISEEQLKRLETHHWPGNVRELRNLIERVVILGEENEIDHIAEAGDTTGNELAMLKLRSLKEAVHEFKKMMIVDVLESTKWRVNKAADRLGISRHTLRYQMESLEIEEHH